MLVFFLDGEEELAVTGVLLLLLLNASLVIIVFLLQFDRKHVAVLKANNSLDIQQIVWSISPIIEGKIIV